MCLHDSAASCCDLGSLVSGLTGKTFSTPTSIFEKEFKNWSCTPTCNSNHEIKYLSRQYKKVVIINRMTERNQINLLISVFPVSTPH